MRWLPGSLRRQRIIFFNNGPVHVQTNKLLSSIRAVMTSCVIHVFNVYAATMCKYDAECMILKLSNPFLSVIVWAPYAKPTYYWTMLIHTDSSYCPSTGHRAWRHQMETFSALLGICAGIHRSPVNSPHKDQWRGALMFSLICVWINNWANNRKAGDLRRHRAYYDVIVMGNIVL